MANALACGKCGNSIASDRLKLEFDGNCPWCLAAFALVDPPQDAPVPRVQGSDRLGKYLLSEKIGTGGMGEVWKAFDTELNRWVALKFLKDQDPKELARFTREAHMAAKLSHPNIAAVYEIGEAGGRHYIAMQCIEGRTLESFPRNDRRLLARLCLEAAGALDHAHRHRVIHRDVKPGNLMVEESEDGMKVVVLDFGLARPIEGGEKLSVSGSVVGTPQYLSPEQARAEKLDERTDVYSLGVTMYEIFTGRAPFEGDNVYEILKKIENEEPVAPRKIKPQINQDLQTIILKCLEKKRERRYDNAKELAYDLKRFLNHEAVLARPPSTIYRLRMKLSKRKSVVAAVAAFLVLVAGAAVVLPKMSADARSRDRLASYRAAYDDGRNVWDEVQQRVGRVPESALDKARLARGHFEKAIGILDQAEAQVMRGRCLQLERKRPEAQEAWERALVLDPGNKEARFHLAKTLLLAYYNGRPVTYISKPGSLGTPEFWVRRGPETGHLAGLRLRAEKLLAGVDSKEKSDYLQGLLQLGRGEYREGARLLGLYNQEGWDGASMVLEGVARLSSGDDIDGAIRAFTRAIELDPKDAVSFVNRGCAKHDKGLFDEAIEDFTTAIQLDPKNATAWSNRGNSNRKKDLFEQAILDCTEAIRLDPRYSTAHFNRGCAKAALDRLDEAIEDYKLAITFDPDSSEAYTNLGCARDARGLHDQAILDFGEAIKRSPNHPLPHYNRGQALANKGRFEEAIVDFNKTLELDPRNIQAIVNRGIIRLKQRRFDDAIADLNRAIELDPNSAHAYFKRGHARDQNGLKEGAFEDYSKAIAADSKFALAYAHRGTLELQKGRLNEAISDFDKAILHDSKCAIAYANRGMVWSQQGHHEKAIADYSKALEVDPEHTAALNNRGLAFNALGRYEEALLDCSKAILLDKKYANAYSSRGLVYQSMGKFDAAIDDFKTAVRLDPDNAIFHLNLGNGYLSKSQYDEAITESNKAIALDSTIAMAFNNLGLAKYRQGHHDEAIAALTRAITLDRMLWRAYVNRGLARTATGLHDDAIADFEVAIQGDPDPTNAYFHRGQARIAKGLQENAIADWEMALKVSPPGWPYRAAVEELISTGGVRLIFKEACRLFALEKFRASNEKFKGIVESHPKSEQVKSSAYNLARGLAFLGEKKSALDWLEKTVELGWKDLAHLEKDSAFESFRGEERYKKVTESLRARLADQK